MEVHKDPAKSEPDTKTFSNGRVDTEDGTEEEMVVEVPDGGWGWLIVFASFMCNAIVDGIIFSYGLFIADFAEVFNETKGRVAWVGSLMAGFYLIIGPVVSGFANAYGCRIVTITGALISSGSIALSALATSMQFLCVTFGLLGGIGFGFIYLPAVVTVGFYFEKKRALATGLAVCGSGVGTFIMAPLVKFLLEVYAWKGTLLILAGIVLHCAIFGSLFRPLTAKSKRTVDKTKTETPMLQKIKELRESEKHKWQSEDYLEKSSAQKNLSSSLPEVCQLPAGIAYLNGSINPSPTGSNNSPPPSYSEVVGEYDRISFLTVDRHDRIMPKRHSEVFNTNNNRYDNNKKKLSLPSEIYLRPFYRKDILYSASLLNLPELESQDIEEYHRSVIKISVPTEEPKGHCCFSPVIKETFKQMMDLTLLKSPTFLVLALAGFVTLAGFFIPFMFVVDRAVTSGISLEQATYILPAIGFTNTVGRVFSGWISDRPNLNALTINNIALIIGGLGTIVSPFLNSFTLLMIYGAVFGFSIACFATLRSIIVVELLGLDKLTNAFGLLLLFQGIAAMLGGPVAGMFYDMTGSYDASFYISGSFILVSGLLGIPLRSISIWEKKRNEQRNNAASGIVTTVTDCSANSDTKVQEV